MKSKNKDIRLPTNYDALSARQRREVRDRYAEEQKGTCMFCGTPLDESPSNEVEAAWIDLTLFPPGFLRHPVHLQHSHETGMTEGAVHARCNAYMWQYKGR